MRVTDRWVLPVVKREQLRDYVLYFYLFYVSAAGLPTLFAGTEPATGGTEGSILNQIVILGTLVAAWFAASDLRLRDLCTGIWPLLPLLVLILATIPWADYPDLSLRRAVRLTIEVLILAMIVGSYRDLDRLFRIATRTFAFVVLLDLLLLLVPSASFTDIGYRGLHGHKNSAGSFMLLAFPFFLITVRSGLPARFNVSSVMVLFSALVILVLSQSKTSVLLLGVSTLLATLLLFVFILRKGDRILFLSLVVGAVASVAMLAALADFSLDDMLGLAISDRTFTGRDRIWEFTWYHISHAPIIGHGYGSFWGTPQTAPIVLRNRYEIYDEIEQAHNGYLDTLVQTGYAGLVLLIFLTVYIFARLWRVQPLKKDRKYLFVCIYVMATFYLHNITESSILRAGFDMWVMFLFANFALLKMIGARGADADAHVVAAPVQQPRDGARTT